MSSADVMQALAEDLRLDLQKPWPGLPAFTEQQHDFFFGREEETCELFRCVKRERLTVLFGKSGLGKTSLLQAGLFPMLRTSGFLPVYIRVSYAENAEGLETQVLAALENAIQHGELAEVASPQAGESLWEYLHRRGGNLIDHEGNVVTPVLVFDQFEECFTLRLRSGFVAEPGEQFLSALADLIENRTPATLAKKFAEDRDLTRRFDLESAGCRILITLREDYLADLEALRDTMPSLVFIDNRLRLTEMTGSQAYTVVASPSPELVAPGVPEFIVRFIAGAQAGLIEGGEAPNEFVALEKLEVAPAILSLFCRQINEQRIAQKLPAITRALVKSQGVTIIDEFYQNCMLDMHPAIRRLIEDRLLTRAGFRNNVDLAEARADLEQAGARSACIDDLVRLRLLQIEEHRGVPRLELTHDVLTDPVKRSRTKWEEEQAREKQRQQQAMALLKAKEAEREALKRVRYVQKMGAAVACMLLLLAGLFIFDLKSQHRAKESEAMRKESELRGFLADQKASAMTALARVKEQEAELEKAKGFEARAKLDTERDRMTGEKVRLLEDNKARVSDVASITLQVCESLYDAFHLAAKPASARPGGRGVEGSSSDNKAWEQYEQLLMNPVGCVSVAQSAHRNQPGDVKIADRLTSFPIRAAASASDRGDRSELQEYSLTAVKLADDLRAETSNRSMQILVARTYMGVAWLLAKDAELSSVAGHAREVGDEIGSSASHSDLNGADWDNLSDVYYYKALYFRSMKDGSEAIRAYRMAVEDEVNAVRRAPDEEHFQQYAIRRDLDLADYEKDLGKNAEAAVAYERALRFSRQFHNEVKVPEIYASLTAVLVADKDFSHAHDLFEERIRALIATPPGLARSLDLKTAYNDAAGVEENRELWRQAVADRTAVLDLLKALQPDAYGEQQRDLAYEYSLRSWDEIRNNDLDAGMADAKVALGMATKMKDSSVASAVYRNEFNALFAVKKYDRARQVNLQRFQSLRDMPRNTEREKSIADAYSDAALVDGEEKKWTSGVDNRTHVLQTLEALEANAYPDLKIDLAVAHGNLSWMDIEAGQFADGLKNASEGYELDNSQKWILVNKAHGLLLTGQIEAGTALYRAIQDQPYQSRLLKEDIVSDLLALCNLTYTRPEMKGIAEGLHSEKSKDFQPLMSCLAANSSTATALSQAP